MPAMQAVEIEGAKSLALGPFLNAHHIEWTTWD